MFADITPVESWEALKNDPNQVLIDCRAAVEWNLIGVPDLSGIGKRLITVEWQSLDGQPNPHFVEQISAILPKETPIHIICRVGGRSAAACQALSAAGYTNLANIAGGFEGQPDAHGHRSACEGWRFHQLPWVQS